jgi:hypothetical protein
LQDYGMRIYNAALGKFLSVDPEFERYLHLSPYCFAADGPIRLIDVNGCGPGDGQKRLICCPTRCEVKKDFLAFEKGATILKNDYANNPDKYGSAVASFSYVDNAEMLISYINKQQPNSIKSLDILGHSGYDGIWFPHVEGADWGWDKVNLYKDSESRTRDYALFGTGSKTLDDINFNNFTNDARIELHGCGTAGEYEWGTDKIKGNTANDNIAISLSKKLYAAGKTRGVVIGHFGPSDGESNGGDYRTGDRCVFWNGNLVYRTKESGHISDATINQSIDAFLKARHMTNSEPR